jgi:hypothetical protein
MKEEVNAYLTGTIGEILEYNLNHPQFSSKRRGKHHTKKDCPSAILEQLERRKKQWVTIQKQESGQSAE